MVASSWVVVAVVVLAACSTPRPRALARPTAVPGLAGSGRSAVPVDRRVPAAATVDEPSPPDAVDLSLPLPERATLLAAAPDGRLLVSVGAMAAVPGASAESQVHTSIRYAAIVDGRRRCIDETLTERALQAVARQGTIEAALVRLRLPETLDEVRRHVELGRLFGLRGLGDVVFGPAGPAIVQANNQLYVIDGSDVTPLGGGPANGLTMSPDGRFAFFGHCRTPCRGRYVPARRDMSTGRITHFPVGDVHDVFWTTDGTLLISYDDARSGIAEARHVCVAHLAPSATRPTTIRCIPSVTTSAEIATASPNRRFFALQSIDPLSRAATLHVLALPSGEELFTLAGDPIRPALDDEGRLAWDDIGGPGHTYRTRVTTAAGEIVISHAQLVGLLPTGDLLVLPDTEPRPRRSGPVRTLAERRCELFETRRSRGPR